MTRAMMKTSLVASLLFAATICANSHPSKSIHQIIAEERRFVVFNSRQLTGECLAICQNPPSNAPTNSKSPTNQPTNNLTAAPTPSQTSHPSDGAIVPSSKIDCSDDPTFRLNGEHWKNCEWVAAANTENRCKKPGVSIGCPATCNPNCTSISASPTTTSTLQSSLYPTRRNPTTSPSISPTPQHNYSKGKGKGNKSNGTSEKSKGSKSEKSKDNTSSRRSPVTEDYYSKGKGKGDRSNGKNKGSNIAKSSKKRRNLRTFHDSRYDANKKNHSEVAQEKEAIQVDSSISALFHTASRQHLRRQ